MHKNIVYKNSFDNDATDDDDDDESCETAKIITLQK
jgi:hypothetical protein